jgi:hypothetical protein
MASTGITRRRSTKDPPMRFPTNTPGFSLRTEFMPTDISEIEVKTPKSRNEVAKEDNLRLFENFSMPFTVIPDDFQMTKHAKKNNNMFKNISMWLFYHFYLTKANLYKKPELHQHDQ